MEVVQDILDGHLLVAFGVNKALGSIEDFSASQGGFFDDSWHRLYPLVKPTVGL